MKSNTLFLLSLLASTLFHASLASGIHYLYFSSAQIQIKSGDVSREIDITFEFIESQPTSVDSNNTRQVFHIDGNKTKQKPIIQSKADTKIGTVTVQSSHPVKQDVSQNAQMGKEKIALLPDEAPVSEDALEDIINKNDLELRTVSGQVESQYPANRLEVKPEVVFPQTKQVEHTETSLAENGIQAYTGPEYIKNPPPKYPRQARKRSLTGKVTLRVEVKTNGSCGYIEIVKTSGYSMLDKAATKAVKEWQFVPAAKWGNAVSSFTEIVVNFQLK